MLPSSGWAEQYKKKNNLSESVHSYIKPHEFEIQLNFKIRSLDLPGDLVSITQA